MTLTAIIYKELQTHARVRTVNRELYNFTVSPDEITLSKVHYIPLYLLISPLLYVIVIIFTIEPLPPIPH